MDNSTYVLLAEKKVRSGLAKADGCSTILKTYVHRWFANARRGCVAHDVGGDGGLLPHVRPGWDNDLNWFSYNWHEGSKLWAVLGIPGVMYFSVFYHYLKLRWLNANIFWALNLSAMVIGWSMWDMLGLGVLLSL